MLHQMLTFSTQRLWIAYFVWTLFELVLNSWHFSWDNETHTTCSSDFCKDFHLCFVIIAIQYSVKEQTTSKPTFTILLLKGKKLSNWFIEKFCMLALFQVISRRPKWLKCNSMSLLLNQRLIMPLNSVVATQLSVKNTSPCAVTCTIWLFTKLINILHYEFGSKKTKQNYITQKLNLICIWTNCIYAVLVLAL